MDLQHQIRIKFQTSLSGAISPRKKVQKNPDDEAVIPINKTFLEYDFLQHLNQFPFFFRTCPSNFHRLPSSHDRNRTRRSRTNTMKTFIHEEKSIIETMIGIFCKVKHNSKNALCPTCFKLNEYAKLKLSKCPFGDEKPTCKNCKIHCYEPEQRELIKQVMAFSGPRLLLYKPAAALRHLIRGWRSNRCRK